MEDRTVEQAQTINLYGLDEDTRDRMKREHPGAVFVDEKPAPEGRKSKSK